MSKLAEKRKKAESVETPQSKAVAEAVAEMETNPAALLPTTEKDDFLDFEEVEEMKDFSFLSFKEIGDTFTGKLIEDCQLSENETFKNFEGIVAETYPEQKTVVLSRHYNVLKFLNEVYSGGICRITLIDKVKGAKGTVCKFKFEQAKTK